MQSLTKQSLPAGITCVAAPALDPRTKGASRILSAIQDLKRESVMTTADLGLARVFPQVFGCTVENSSSWKR
jgi:hypothetical protein